MEKKKKNEKKWRLWRSERRGAPALKLQRDGLGRTRLSGAPQTKLEGSLLGVLRAAAPQAPTQVHSDFSPSFFISKPTISTQFLSQTFRINYTINKCKILFTFTPKITNLDQELLNNFNKSRTQQSLNKVHEELNFQNL